MTKPDRYYPTKKLDSANGAIMMISGTAHLIILVRLVLSRGELSIHPAIAFASVAIYIIAGALQVVAGARCVWRGQGNTIFAFAVAAEITAVILFFAGMASWFRDYYYNDVVFNEMFIIVVGVAIAGLLTCVNIVLLFLRVVKRADKKS